ncbi:hypothetical protein O3M35_004897 [Rhynocoris fuscipes]|uniref:Uncharacterized protein n=1 Tax=Rhynocoris fuscipes TaxID=488301 RepID=A0AAW1DHL6_9HEMI
MRGCELFQRKYYIAHEFCVQNCIIYGSVFGDDEFGGGGGVAGVDKCPVIKCGPGCGGGGGGGGAGGGDVCPSGADDGVHHGHSLGPSPAV